MISQEQLKEVLIEQQETILKKPSGIEREILNEIEKKLKLPHVIVITGLRRSGKSTLLRQIIKKYYQDKNFYYINFEDERLFNFKAEEFSIIHENLIELFGEKEIFFIDEIQNVNNFEIFVRRLYESGKKFFITGSNAKLLSKELGTKLTGRHVKININPFSFKEYLILKNQKLEKNSIYKLKEKTDIKKHFGSYLRMGGMPEYLIYKDPEIITRIYQDIIIKDVAVRYNIEHYKELKELTQYLITTNGQKFSYNSLKKIVSINSSNTIKKYVDYLEETNLLKTINKFDYSLKKQIINDKKSYVIDNSFISQISMRNSKNTGWLLENLVFNVLTKNKKIFYYKNKHECDFLIKEGNKITQVIQVCYELHQENKERELKGLKEAMKELKIKEGIIITNDQEEKIEEIKVIPAWKWLLTTKNQ